MKKIFLNTVLSLYLVFTPIAAFAAGWTVTLPDIWGFVTSMAALPGTDNFVVHMPSSSGPNLLMNMDKDGAVIWKNDSEKNYSSTGHAIVTLKDKVYSVESGTEQLQAFDSKSGELMWKTNFPIDQNQPSSFLQMSAPPIVLQEKDGRFIYFASRSMIYKIKDIGTSYELIWRIPFLQKSSGEKIRAMNSPIFAGGMFIQFGMDTFNSPAGPKNYGSIYAVRQNGLVQWSIDLSSELKENFPLITNFSANNKTLYYNGTAENGNGTIVARAVREGKFLWRKDLSRTTGTQKWDKVFAPYYAGILVDTDKIYVPMVGQGASTYQLSNYPYQSGIAAFTLDGKQLWFKQLDGLVDIRQIHLTESGKLLALGVATYDPQTQKKYSHLFGKYFLMNKENGHIQAENYLDEQPLQSMLYRNGFILNVLKGGKNYLSYNDLGQKMELSNSAPWPSQFGGRTNRSIVQDSWGYDYQLTY